MSERAHAEAQGWGRAPGKSAFPSPSSLGTRSWGRRRPLPPLIHRGCQVPRNATSPRRACSRRSQRLCGHVSPSGSKVRVSRGPANPAEGGGRGRAAPGRE